MVIVKAIFFSAFFIVLGAVVWKKQIINFISGFDRMTINNPRRVAKTIGIIIMAYGLEMGVLIIVNAYIVSMPADIVAILAIIHGLGILFCFLQDRFLSNE